MKELICICCPLGCMMKIDEDTLEVTGYTCIRGKNYAINELTAPKRMVTSICKVLGGEINVVSCKTAEAIDKDKIFECLEEISKITLNAPVYEKDIIIKNVLNTGVDVIATKNVMEVKGE